jgi:hypothetical protein
MKVYVPACGTCQFTGNVAVVPSGVTLQLTMPTGRGFAQVLFPPSGFTGPMTRTGLLSPARCADHEFLDRVEVALTRVRHRKRQRHGKGNDPYSVVPVVGEANVTVGALASPCTVTPEMA